MNAPARAMPTSHSSPAARTSGASGPCGSTAPGRKAGVRAELRQGDRHERQQEPDERPGAGVREPPLGAPAGAPRAPARSPAAISPAAPVAAACRRPACLAGDRSSARRATRRGGRRGGRPAVARLARAPAREALGRGRLPHAAREGRRDAEHEPGQRILEEAAVGERVHEEGEERSAERQPLPGRLGAPRRSGARPRATASNRARALSPRARGDRQRRRVRHECRGWAVAARQPPARTGLAADPDAHEWIPLDHAGRVLDSLHAVTRYLIQRLASDHLHRGEAACRDGRAHREHGGRPAQPDRR